MVAVYLREACRTVLSEISSRRMTRGDFGELLGYDEAQTRRLRRKLNGEYPAQLEDLMEWAAVLDRPDLLFAPSKMADLVPKDISPAAVLSLIQ